MRYYYPTHAGPTCHCLLPQFPLPIMVSLVSRPGAGAFLLLKLPCVEPPANISAPASILGLFPFFDVERCHLFAFLEVFRCLRDLWRELISGFWVVGLRGVGSGDGVCGIGSRVGGWVFDEEKAGQFYPVEAGGCPTARQGAVCCSANCNW